MYHDEVDPGSDESLTRAEHPDIFPRDRVQRQVMRKKRFLNPKEETVT